MELKIKDIKFVKSDKFHRHLDVSDQMIQDVIQKEFPLIQESVSSGRYSISITHDFHTIIGVTHCISCPPNTPGVYFKRRGNRPYLSRMIKGREPEDCSSCTVIIRYEPDKSRAVIISSWIGGPSKPELGNINYFEKCSDPFSEIMASAMFWMNHALIEE